MKLEKISVLSGELELVTGLHIGSGDAGMKIGGIDSPVIKHPITEHPYIPGSSLKGKMRSLLEWRAGTVQASNGAPLSWNEATTAEGKNIVRLFGQSASAKLETEQALEMGPTRLSFWDCSLNAEWAQSVIDKNLPLTEEKSENSIDRIKAVAISPRFIERVPAGAIFDFKLTIKTLTGDKSEFLDHILQGLKLLELDGIGGSGSRGYGKIKFNNLALDEQDLSEQFKTVTIANLSE